MKNVRPVGEYDSSEDNAVRTSAAVAVTLAVVEGLNYAAYYFGGWYLVLYMWFCVVLLLSAAAKFFADAIMDHYDMETGDELAGNIFLIWFAGSIFFLELLPIMQ